MRIALLTNFIPPYRVPLFESVAAQADEMHVFISTEMEANRAWKPDWGTLDVVVQKCWTLNQKWRHPQGFEDSVYVHIPYDTLSQLRRDQPDVVISGEMGLRTLFAALYCKVFRHVPLVLWLTASEHTEQGRGGLRHTLRKWLFRRVDAVLVNGQSGARYAKRFGIRDEQLFFAPYTPDVAALAQVPLDRTPTQANRLLYVGQLVPRKGLMPFFETLRRWAEDHPEHHVEFWLAGQGPLQEALQAVPMPSTMQIRFLGQVPFDKIADVYKEVGLLAFPTLADEWGLVVNEAMVAGLPVLGSIYSQAVEELVTKGKTGWTFRPDQPDEIYQALTDAFAASPEQQNAMRAHARETALALTPERIAHNIMQAIHHVTSP